MAEMFLGQIPEAIYFSMFLIYVKQIKTKRILFITLMIILYVTLAKMLPNNLLQQFFHMFGVYITLKFLYKNKARITDIITFFISTIIMPPIIIVSTLLFKNMIIVALIFIIFSIVFLYLTRKKLCKIENFYNKFWNRNDKNRIKSVTVRCLSSFIINITFYIMYIWLLYGSIIMQRR